MGIGHDESVSRQDKTRAHPARAQFPLTLPSATTRLRLLRLLRHTGERRTKETPEELLHFWVHVAVPPFSLRANTLKCADVDHRGTYCIHKGCEIWQPSDQGCTWRGDTGRTHGGLGLHTLRPQHDTCTQSNRSACCSKKLLVERHGFQG